MQVFATLGKATPDTDSVRGLNLGGTQVCDSSGDYIAVVE
jgi:hypothetical protein